MYRINSYIPYHYNRPPTLCQDFFFGVRVDFGRSNRQKAVLKKLKTSFFNTAVDIGLDG